MGKYVKYYEFEDIYKVEKDGLVLPNVSYTEDERNVYYNQYATPSTSGVVGDIAVFDGKNIQVIPSEEYFSKYSGNTSITPIGIVVIPSSHDPRGEDRSTIMSLAYMDCDNPTNGNRYVNGYGISFGYISKDIPELYSYNRIITCDETSTTVGTIGQAYLPSENGKYYWQPHTFSPYLSDGSKNDKYFSGGTMNVLSDVDGITNTNTILKYATYQSDWKTTNSIEDDAYEYGCYPAACCCARYRTLGTKSMCDLSEDEINNGIGFWYLPSIGELGYLHVKRNTINTILNNLYNLYYIKRPELLISNGLGGGTYASSSEWGDFDSWYLESSSLETAFNGEVSADAKDVHHNVRAFCRV